MRLRSKAWLASSGRTVVAAKPHVWEEKSSAASRYTARLPPLLRSYWKPDSEKQGADFKYQGLKDTLGLCVQIPHRTAYDARFPDETRSRRCTPQTLELAPREVEGRPPLSLRLL